MELTLSGRRERNIERELREGERKRVRKEKKSREREMEGMLGRKESEKIEKGEIERMKWR